LLTRAVARLPARCRQVFTLRKVYGLSQKEIAASLSISENTVEQHLAKGVRLCTAALAGSHVAQRGVASFEKARRRAERSS
jgi:RNA polymerase sigma factor (sigma-70 family)